MFSFKKRTYDLNWVLYSSQLVDPKNPQNNWLIYGTLISMDRFHIAINSECFSLTKLPHVIQNIPPNEG